MDKDGKITEDKDTAYVIDPESPYNNIIMAKDTVSRKTEIITFAKEPVSVESAGKISYYRTDELQSVTKLLSKTGRIESAITYDEFGKPEYTKEQETSRIHTDTWTQVAT